ncbi:hypothetical protein CAS74_001625 [Pichia kudriavzevii]|uniref:Uncharacterized protein n=1 Tax=Pichia kudriavzevii TaxID=4909 RepID=A0A1Z8JRS9_PICKU|nr:hypothetical protein CAS74_001625 [Pichia kudriavzevii]
MQILPRLLAKFSNEPIIDLDEETSKTYCTTEKELPTSKQIEKAIQTGLIHEPDIITQPLIGVTSTVNPIPNKATFHLLKRHKASTLWNSSNITNYQQLRNKKENPHRAKSGVDVVAIIPVNTDARRDATTVNTAIRTKYSSSVPLWTSTTLTTCPAFKTLERNPTNININVKENKGYNKIPNTKSYNRDGTVALTVAETTAPNPKTKDLTKTKQFFSTATGIETIKKFRTITQVHTKVSKKHEESTLDYSHDEHDEDEGKYGYEYEYEHNEHNFGVYDKLDLECIETIDIIEAEERILKIFKYKHLNGEPIKIPNYTRYLINSAHLREEGFSWYLN